MSVCPACRVSYSVFLEQEVIDRPGCFRHWTETPPPDADAARRLRRAWASSPTYPIVRPAALTVEERAAAADLRDDQRVERLRKLEAVTSTEDRLLAVFNLPALEEMAA